MHACSARSAYEVRPNVRVGRALVTILIAVGGCVSSDISLSRAFAAGAERSTGFRSAAQQFDPSVPTPTSVIGHAVGDGAVRYDALIRYLRALADASPFVTLTPYAESHEGRALHYLTITSRENHEQLDRIKADNAKLADPRKLGTPQNAEGIIDDLPGVAWLPYAIHGDELSSTDAAMQVAYELAAGTDAATKALRHDLVIHIDPLMNPDGRERYLHQLQNLSGKVLNTDNQAHGRAGHVPVRSPA